MADRFRRSWVALCGVALAAGLAFSQTPAPSPHIQFDATEIDLGNVVHGQDAVATFTYRNSGTVPLHILAAKPG